GRLLRRRRGLPARGWGAWAAGGRQLSGPWQLALRQRGGGGQQQRGQGNGGDNAGFHRISPSVNSMNGIYVRISRCCDGSGSIRQIFLIAPGDVTGNPPAADQVLDVAKPFGGQRHQAAGCDKALLAIGQGDARPLDTTGSRFAARAFEAEQTDKMQPKRADLGGARLRGGADRRLVRARIDPVDAVRYR